MDVILGKKKETSLEDVYNDLSKDFIHHEDVVKTLFIGYTSGTNVILSGKAGYGKSEMAEAFLRSLGYESEDIGIFPVSIDTSPEEFFGNINLEKMHADNKFEMNIETSMFSKPVVILEEMFDGTPAAIASLKQVLTKKEYHYNGQIYPIKTQFIIGCTNKTTEEFNSSNEETIRALIERFPINRNVYWPSHSAKDYSKLIKKKFPKLTLEETSGLGNLYANSRFEGGYISPRIAISATKTFEVNRNIDDLQFVLPTIDSSLLDSMRNSFTNFKKEKDLSYILEHSLVQKSMKIVTPLIDKVEINITDIKTVVNINERIAGYEAMVGVLQDIRRDVESSINPSTPSLLDILNSTIYNRLLALHELATSLKKNCFAKIDSDKQNSIFAMYSTVSIEREEMATSLRNMKDQ